MDPKEIASVQQPGTILPGPAPRPVGRPVEIPPGESFRTILDRTASSGDVRFSAHATARLQSRNIALSKDDVAKINAMTDKAAAKGAKQSLFLLRDVAMVVSVSNRTVITAVDRNSLKDNIFTNIDSAAVIS